MDTGLITEKFERMGARLKIEESARRSSGARSVVVDIKEDGKGEYFDLLLRTHRIGVVDVIDLQPKDRHLLLYVKSNDPEPRKAWYSNRPIFDDRKQKFLCGFDERHWFVAAVPEDAGASNVKTAKLALKPEAVRDAEAKAGIGSHRAQRRKNRASIRQGEWFFIPHPELIVDPKAILHNEPLRRGTVGKPHWADELFRQGGEIVYVCDRFPNGLTAKQHRNYILRNPESAKFTWQIRARNATAFVRGRIRHPDHRTIVLNSWHLVVMNTETRARAMRHVAFID